MATRSLRSGASLIFGVGVSLIVSTGALAQTTVWVDDATCPATGIGTQVNPYCRIQTAICNHRLDLGGVLIRVKPGNYNESVMMAANVQLVSTDGPDVTFIDPTGKPCIVDWCTPGGLIPCSGVLFPLGANGRLEGFTVHHGQGFRQSSLQQIGGGIAIYASSPTITRNTIENNVLSPVSPATVYFYGGGIYLDGSEVSPASPVITRNLIRNNVASPEGGTLYYPSSGIGGAIYAGYNSAPTIRQNTIESNFAGFVDDLFQIGVGGGIAIYSGWLGTTAIIQRNLIRGNSAGDYGGGIMLGDQDVNLDGLADPSRATIENNIIVENEAPEGGGAYTSTTTAVFTHNTIADNTATVDGTSGGRGGGIRTSAPGPGTTFQPTFVNNIIAFNQAIPGDAGGGLGGGIYVSTQCCSNPVMRYDDLYGNLPTNVAGSKVDGSYIGLDGNVSLNPDFVNAAPGSRNYRLRATSPLIDIGDNANSSPEDADGTPRPQVGPGGGAAIVDIGAYEWSIDTDLDGIPDSLDPDDDNDGVADASDCRPLDPALSGPSAEIAGVGLAKTGGTTVSWNNQSPSVYDVVSGALAVLRSTGTVQAATCQASSLAANAWPDPRPDPVSGAAYYYLVRGRNVCGSGDYGFSSSGAPRVPTAACP